MQRLRSRQNQASLTKRDINEHKFVAFCPYARGRAHGVTSACELHSELIDDALWKLTALSARDRSIVTVAPLVARMQTVGMPHYFSLALDNDVTPREVSEILTHLAFYLGWSNAFSAVAIAKDIFVQRGIGEDELAEILPKLLPIDEAAESQRAAMVEQNFGAVAPGVVQYTTDLLFRDLWLRPGLAPRVEASSR